MEVYFPLSNPLILLISSIYVHLFGFPFQENVRLNGQVTLKSEMLKTLSEEKSKMETSLAEKSQLVAKREATVKAVSQELVKANEASKKLQAEARRQTDKVKLSHKIVSEQEKLISK